MVSKTAIGTPAGPRSQTFTRYSRLIMPTPSTAQLRAAIEVLNMPGERINNNAGNSVIQLADTRLGDDFAARTEARTIEQITRIQTVTAQLGEWRTELTEQRRHYVPHRV